MIVDIGCDIFGFNLQEVGPAEVFIAEDAEDVIDDGGREFDIRVVDGSPGLKTGEGEAVHELFKRHAALQALGDGNGEAVQHGAERRTLFAHVDKDFAESTVFVFPCSQEDLLIGHVGFLRKTDASLREPPPCGPANHRGRCCCLSARPYR